MHVRCLCSRCGPPGATHSRVTLDISIFVSLFEHFQRLSLDAPSPTEDQLPTRLYREVASLLPARMVRGIGDLAGRCAQFAACASTTVNEGTHIAWQVACVIVAVEATVVLAAWGTMAPSAGTVIADQ